MKKQLKVSLRVTVFFMILAIAGILQSIPGADWGTKAQAASYSGDYRYWSQGASDDYNMRQYGCWVTAQAKLLYETNVDRSAGFNPDSYLNWQRWKCTIHLCKSERKTTYILRQLECGC